MELWDRLVTLFQIMRGSGLQRYELTGRLQTVLLERANREPPPVEEIQEQLLGVGPEQFESAEELKKLWDSLSDREKEITALTCLGYTNRQIAAKLRIAVNTVKGYVKQALAKYQLHSKAELRNLLEEWDFSDWAPPAQ
jgi:DNA-binding CsgD family transcriptional regulator